MSRTTITLIVVLAVQLILLALFSTGRHHVTEKALFLSQDTSRIDFVKIKNKDGEITMVRSGGTWRITEPFNYPANPSYTETLLKKVSDLKYESLITRNKEKYVDYEVDGEEAAYVEIGNKEGTLDKFYCGKPSKNYTHTYIRKADSDEIWLVTGTPRSSFTRKPKDWRDKKILSLDKTLLERILLKFPDETVELVRNISTLADDTTLTAPDTAWTVIPQKGKPFAPFQKTMNRIKNTLSRMNAMDFKVKGIDEIPSFDDPDFTVEAFLEGDQHVVVDFVPDPEKDNRFLARKDGNEETIFVIYESSVKNLKKRPADFVEEDKGK